MDFDFYGNAVEEYIADYSEMTKSTLKKAKVSDDEIDFMIQNERNILERLLEINKKYVQLIMDLRIYRANELCNMILLTQFVRKKILVM